MIRKATTSDIPSLVEIHMTALAEDLLPRLGRDFLRKEFYPIVLMSNDAVTLVHVERETPDAFIIFAYDSKGLTNSVMRNRIALAKYLCLGLFKNISLIREIAVYAKQFRTEVFPGVRLDIEHMPELYLMATVPEQQSKGIGGRLMSRGLDILSQRSSSCLVKTSCDRAREFYLKHQFEAIGFEYRGSRKMHLLLHEMNRAL